MKKFLGTLLVFSIVISVGCVIKSWAQIPTNNIDSINVNFDTNSATVTMTSGYISNNGIFVSYGIKSVENIKEPAYDQMMNELTEENALNLNALQQVILNSI